MVDAASKGIDSNFGHPVMMRAGTAMARAQAWMSTMPRKGSIRIFSNAFQPACIAAAARTMKKTVRDKGGSLEAGEGRLNPFSLWHYAFWLRKRD
jgi:hypothetical protein